MPTKVGPTLVGKFPAHIPKKRFMFKVYPQKSPCGKVRAGKGQGWGEYP
ncbi:hypothetical protein TREPR_1161 [Treponema primitia ZAS-2]|uniref:Uncharacterized protein n=1 Tax=Treponema primitia (strain ATCC BAA-887 / DSM 12427 / ZAS-2) TaxID=545694 RepID=F5YGW7_TREPZ|nr:hypothetical protein TREPR_1161 [Treponema primitia ZAS-2]